MSDSTIKINTAQAEDLDVDLGVDGVSESDKVEIRLVIIAKSAGCNIAIPCVKVQGPPGKWKAPVPALPMIKDVSGKYYIEVIIGGYYFKPAEGTIEFAVNPTAKVSKSQKPKKIVKEDVDGLGSGGTSPTTALLVPEFEPTDDDIKTDDEQGAVVTRDPRLPAGTLSDIGDVTTPGLGDNEPQAGADREPEEPVNDEPLDADITPEEFEEVIAAAEEIATEYDARSVAESILSKTIGTHAKPTVRGSLFKRDASGRVAIKGLDSPELQAIKEANAEKVRKLLKG